MCDLLFYSVARRRTPPARWLADPPAPLGRFLRGEAGVREAALAASAPHEPVRRWVEAVGDAVRVLWVAIGWAEREGGMMPDDEVAVVVREWEVRQRRRRRVRSLGSPRGGVTANQPRMYPRDILRGI
ncbi:hypothetical protein BD413DRAFT_593179 [Trametes elegans]|nr:hypothetical protein BD413DRAFT_593179 [Trametes elegans]